MKYVHMDCMVMDATRTVSVIMGQAVTMWMELVPVHLDGLVNFVWTVVLRVRMVLVVTAPVSVKMEVRVTISMATVSAQLVGEAIFALNHVQLTDMDRIVMRRVSV